MPLSLALGVMLSVCVAAPPGKESPAQASPSIQVSILLDRKEFFLGESIAAEFVMHNTSRQPASYGTGSVYPTLRLMESFRMSAIKVDDTGKTIGGSVAIWPMPPDLGGMVGNGNLEPGEKDTTTLYVTRYLRFTEPGRYLLKIENIDQYDHNAVKATGQTFLTLKQPMLDEARTVYQRMKQMPRKAWIDGPGVFLANAADFDVMHQPVYLPVLKEFADQGDLEALPSLERAESLAANEILVGVMARALDRDHWQLARACFQHLKPSLPFPNWFDKINTNFYQAERDRVARTWKPESGPVLTRLARRLTQEITLANEKRTAPSLPPMADAQSLLGDIDYVYRCLGSAEDLSDCLEAYETSIELTKTLPLETHQYFRPRGSAYGFQHTLVRMLQRGTKPPFPPTSRSETAAFVIALRTQNSFRPAGWEDEIIRWARRQDTPYLRELILEYTPAPVPKSLLDLLPEMLLDPYVDLAIAACHVAQKNPHQTFQQPIEKILEQGREEYLLNAAADAGPANGVTNDKIMEIWISRMSSQDLDGEAVVRLLKTALDDNRARSEPELSPQTAAQTKARWQRFIAENRERLRTGPRFKISDPAITPDLFPAGFQYYRDGKPWPREAK